MYYHSYTFRFDHKTVPTEFILEKLYYFFLVLVAPKLTKQLFRMEQSSSGQFVT